MMKFQNYVEVVAITIEPSVKDISAGSLTTKAKYNASTPVLFIIGTKWLVEHNCLMCKSKVEFGQEFIKNVFHNINYCELGYLSRQGQDTRVVDLLAIPFNRLALDDYTRESGFRVYSYKLKGNGNEVGGVPAQVLYYKCVTCQAQYLAIYTLWYGEDEGSRIPPESDRFYIEQIACVEFNEK